MATRREESWKPTVHSRVCDKHFVSSDYYLRAYGVGGVGVNNNPALRTALKRLLSRASIVASMHVNCITFEDETSSPIFSLKWSKSRPPLCTDNDFSSEDGSSDDILDIIPCIEPLAP